MDSLTSANQVHLRVQVIDMQPQTLKLTLPVYLKASDLSQRIARDAGLQQYWPDRTRKQYALRARGRLLQPQETLKDLKVINDELIYILPHIRPNTPVGEQFPDYPDETTYAAGATGVLILLSFFALLISIGWG